MTDFSLYKLVSNLGSKIGNSESTNESEYDKNNSVVLVETKADTYSKSPEERFCYLPSVKFPS